jgi:type VI secretion system protein ImpF
MVPLFDRLGLELGNFEGINKNYLTPTGVEQSVLVELNRLATTRSKLTFDEFIKYDLTVLDYGLPDFTGYSVQNDDHRIAVKTAVVKAIETFEPRLKKINVTIFPNSTNKNVSYFGVDAVLVLGKEFQRVSFTINNKNNYVDSIAPQELFK